MDEQTLKKNVEKITAAAGPDAKISVEQNQKNSSVAVRITLYEKKRQ
jgi:hypothetical protein